MEGGVGHHLGAPVESRLGMAAPLASTNSVILLVEDDEDIRTSTAESLEGEGFAVIGAETVDEGLARLRQGTSPAVILLDLMMPGRNGWDLARPARRPGRAGHPGGRHHRLWNRPRGAPEGHGRRRPARAEALQQRISETSDCRGLGKHQQVRSGRSPFKEPGTPDKRPSRRTRKLQGCPGRGFLKSHPQWIPERISQCPKQDRRTGSSVASRTARFEE